MLLNLLEYHRDQLSCLAISLVWETVTVLLKMVCFGYFFATLAKVDEKKNVFFLVFGKGCPP